MNVGSERKKLGMVRKEKIYVSSSNNKNVYTHILAPIHSKNNGSTNFKMHKKHTPTQEGRTAYRAERRYTVEAICALLLQEW